MKLIIRSKNEEANKQLKKLNGITTKLLLRTSGIKIQKISDEELHMIYSEMQTSIIRQVPKKELDKYIEKQLEQMNITKKDYEIIIEE